MEPLKLSGREVFWDSYLVNTSRTSASLKQHPPRREEVVITLDRPWEGDGCDYFSIICLDGVYRMYYLAWEMFDPNITVHKTNAIKICCIESRDGIHWERPSLNLRQFDGAGDNNILLDESDGTFDNFHVFLDENPACPPSERIKATAVCDHDGALWCYTSQDGYRFQKGWIITDKGYFDTQNVAFWVPERGEYLCYIRDFHDYEREEWPWRNDGVRDIRWLSSPDFKTWTDPVLLDFGDSEDIALYTNAVFRYPRAPQILVGMPSRYVERRAWTDNFAQLTGAQARQQRIQVSPRYGLTTTDCVLMTSRDGRRWQRQDEAWFTPGIEHDYNWVYGDCYPTPGLIQTPSPLPGAPDEYSFYCDERHWSQQPAYLRRYSIRQDGLFSYHADYAPRTLTTKPILYEGGCLSLNFDTSARGSIFVTISDGKTTLHSCELFGDTLDRRVAFDGDLSQFEGREIVLEFTMSDANLYSLQFLK